MNKMFHNSNLENVCPENSLFVNVIFKEVLILCMRKS